MLKGEILARGVPHLGITAHASTSGTITEIVEHPVPNASGLPELCAIMDADGEDMWHKLPPIDYLDSHNDSWSLWTSSRF